MPIHREGDDEIAARHLREHAIDRRARRWFWVRIAATCLAFSALGLVLMGFSFHTADRDIGMIFFYGAQVVGYGGILGTLWRASVVRADRGW